jgi:hypothetical protein
LWWIGSQINQKTDGDAISLLTNAKTVPKMITPALLKEVLLVETVKHQKAQNSNVIKPIQRTQNVTNVTTKNLAAKNITLPAKHALLIKINSLATIRP